MKNCRGPLLAILLIVVFGASTGMLWLHSDQAKMKHQAAIDEAARIPRSSWPEKTRSRVFTEEEVAAVLRKEKIVKLDPVDGEWKVFEAFEDPEIIPDPSSSHHPVGDFYPTWPPSGQGPMPSLIRPSDY